MPQKPVKLGGTVTRENPDKTLALFITERAMTAIVFQRPLFSKVNFKSITLLTFNNASVLVGRIRRKQIVLVTYGSSVVFNAL